MMPDIRFVARCDDLGSSRSANRAIQAVTEAGFMKNVSVMAPGPEVEDAAQLLANNKDICFGMHTTLNAEWDRVKWGPVLPLPAESGLVDGNGWFLASPGLFAKTKPTVETIMREVEAQLEKLHKLGFGIRYIDSHMFPECTVPGMDEAMADFARRKGLIDHMYYYRLPPGLHNVTGGADTLLEALKALPGGQYFFVCHPSMDTEEMRQTGNAQASGETVAKARAEETRIFSAPELCAALKSLGCVGIRYDEAMPQKRATVEDLMKILAAQ